MPEHNEINLKNLEETKKSISDIFDSLYYQSNVKCSNLNIDHYFIEYYSPRNRDESQDTFSINIINFKKGNSFAVREFTKIVNSIISIESIQAKYVIPIPSSTKDKVSQPLKELCVSVAKNNNMEYLEALKRIISVKSSHLSPGDRPTYQDHFDSLKCVNLFSSDRVLLLDDVYTQGNTAQASIDRLIQNKVGEVYLITLGKTLGYNDIAIKKYQISQNYDKSYGIPKDIKGVIFDLDGTLVDSSMIKHLSDGHKWKEARENIYQIREYGEVSNTLIELKKRYKIGLVTSSPEGYALSIVKIFGFSFDAYVFYHDTQNHKPHPEPLIECARRLCLKPEDCVAIGDEVIDIHAARRAGMKDAAAIWGSLEKNKILESKPSLIYESPEDIIDKRQD
ncbi:MAG: HAD-IA family hydrolase [Candidatus Methanofastidiosum sp.]|nr:HAD-IA family hydrolase [Methanofastidiosum sp.]